jgi:hypothetical protein
MHETDGVLCEYELRPKKHLTTCITETDGVLCEYELRPKKQMATDAQLRQTMFSVRQELRPKKQMATDA